MSKKQREKVEDEVRFHRAQMKAAEAAPDSSVFEHQIPSSSDQHHTTYNGGWVPDVVLMKFHKSNWIN